MRNLNLEMVRVTEGAAIAAAAFVGCGDKIAADLAATEAMRERLAKIDFQGRVVIGEGKKDNAPGLFRGDKVGKDLAENEYDIAVDPLDGTTPTSKGGNEAMSVIAVGNKNAFLETEEWYMWKLAYGPTIVRNLTKQECHVELLSGSDADLSHLINLLTKAANKHISKFTVCILDRPRHDSIITTLRKIGCRIKLIQDCDVSAAIATAMPESGIDVYLGIGGTPEGVLGAAALKCLGGCFQGKSCEQSNTIYTTEELAKGDVIFCATGVTDGSLLKGVRWTSSAGPITHSILMRSESGTVRFIQACHGN